MQVHTAHDFLDIQWDQEVSSVIMTWKKFAKGEDFRQGLDEGLELLEHHGTSKWLADLRDLGTVTKDDQEWSNEQWYPRAINGGIRYMAIIMPKSVISSMSVTNILTRVKDINVETQYFDDIDSAKEWLWSKS